MDDSEFLHDFIISQYIVDRIIENGYYFNKSPAEQTHHIDNINNKIIDDKLLFLQFLLTVLINELKQGNTVVIIDDNFDDIVLGYFKKIGLLSQTNSPLNTNNPLNINNPLNANNILSTHKNDFQDIIKKHSDTLIITEQISPKQQQLLINFCILCYECLFFFRHNSNIQNMLSYFEQILTDHNAPPPFVYQMHQNKIVIWLYRSFYAENNLAWRIKQLIRCRLHVSQDDTEEQLKQMITKSTLLPNDQQKLAIACAIGSNFSLITGGPGTGKTLTVAKIVTLLVEYMGISSDKIALVAPTGKAAQRMQESLQNSLQKDNIAITLPEAMTIHRLLASTPMGQTLPFLVIVVDEASMLGVELASHLVSAIDDNTRLILLGDTKQLSAVDAGAVLADLCQIDSLACHHVMLEQSRRFDDNSDVGKLAQLINQADTYPVNRQSLQNLINQSAHLSFIDKNQANKYTQLIQPFEQFFEILKAIWLNKANSQDFVAQALMDSLNRYRILSASQHKTLGKNRLNEHIKQHYLAFCNQQNLAIKEYNNWYHGRVVMVNKNNYELELFNGDVGICVACTDGLFVFFDGKKTPLLASTLNDNAIENAYAMTIHKSQGSEFDRVAVCLDGDERLFGRELVYTAITRAKHQVDIYADIDELVYAINQSLNRQTGLALLFQQPN